MPACSCGEGIGWVGLGLAAAFVMVRRSSGWVEGNRCGEPHGGSAGGVPNLGRPSFATFKCSLYLLQSLAASRFQVKTVEKSMS